MELGNSLNYSLWDVRGPVRDSIDVSVEDSVYDLVRTSIYNSLDISIWGSVCNSVYIKKHNKFA